MAVNVINYTSYERSVRKHWLIATISSSFVYPMMGFFMLVILKTFSPVTGELLLATFMKGLTAAAFAIIDFFVIYHCAYKKHGTKLLTLSMIAGPMLLALQCVDTVFIEHKPINLFGDLMQSAFFAWWFYCSRKMKAVNIKYRTLYELKPQEYVVSLDAMKNAMTLENLDILFADLMRSWPQYEPISYSEYKIKKLSLEASSLVQI